MNLRDIDLKISFRYQGIHTIRGTLGSEPLLERLPIQYLITGYLNLHRHIW